MPKLLIVSPHFPPVNAPDMQRVRMSLPHFVAAGWDVTVLTVDDPHPQAPLEPDLLATIPPEVRIVRVPVLSRTWTRLLGVNNIAWRALPYLHAAARRLLRRGRFDLVYFSTTQFAVLPLARLWRRESGVPYVIDLQDPWLSDYYERPGVTAPGGWKYRFARAFARALEGWTLRACAHVISVSPAYLATLRQRYAFFSAARGSVITFGVPEDDFVVARRLATSRPPLLPRSVAFKLAYAGRLGRDMEPALHLLFAALARTRTQSTHPVEAHFFGTSYAAAGAPRTRALAIAHGVEDLVHERPARIPYLDSLRLLLEADAVLLLGSDETAYSPSKTYPTLHARRPTFAIAPAGSVLENILGGLGGATVASFRSAAGTDEVAIQRLADALVRLARGESWTPDRPLDETLLGEHFSARAVARRQLEVFGAAIANERTRRAPATTV